MKGGRVLALASAMAISGTISAKAGEPLSGRDLMRLFPGQLQAVVNGAMIMGIKRTYDGSLVGSILGESNTGRRAIRSGSFASTGRSGSKAEQAVRL